MADPNVLETNPSAERVGSPDAPASPNAPALTRRPGLFVFSLVLFLIWMAILIYWAVQLRERTHP